jgi:SAM-dependent methyltransferase
MNGDRIGERLRWMCAQVHGEPVLDIGCGEGIATILVAREGREVVGVDRATATVEAARERLRREPELVRTRVRFDIAEATDLPFEDGGFAAILLGDLLARHLSPAALIEAADRVLVPGGEAVVTVPYGTSGGHDDKHPLYLGSLLELLSQRWDVRRATLIDNHLGVALRKPGAGDAPAEPPWRDAVRLADARVAVQEETGDRQQQRLTRLRSEVDALIAERGQQLKLQAELEAARTQLLEAEERVRTLELSERRLHSELEVAQLANARAEAERDEAQRLTEALRDV